MASNCNVSQLANLDDLDWEYLAEGRANVVFACTTQGIVLRVRKEVDIVGSEKYSKDSIYGSEEQVIYINEIIFPLLKADDNLVTPKLVNISTELLNLLSDKRNKCRPNVRSDSSLDQTCRTGFVLPHLGYLNRTEDHIDTRPSISVEIKPKWGFLPCSPMIKSQHQVKKTTCRYCMHQYLKLRNGKISAISSYCPLDLFSKSSCRIKKALKSLFANPQNNLRVFVDGVLVYSGIKERGIPTTLSDFECLMQERIPTFLTKCSQTKNNLDSFTDYLINILTEILINDSWGSNDTRKDNKCSAELSVKCNERVGERQSECDTTEWCRSVGSGGLLNRVRLLQQFGGMDIEDIHSLYCSKIEEMSFSQMIAKLKCFRSPVWKIFVENTKSLSEDIPMKEQNLSTDEEVEKRSDGQEDDFKSLSHIQKFLIASTLRDCSIMITFKQCSMNDSRFPIIAGHRYAFQIKLVDLDPRPHQIIPYQYKLDHSIVNNYIMKTTGEICCP